MPYMSSERTAEIRKAIKAALPEYTFSITNSNHSGVRIDILSGPIQLLSTEKTIEAGNETVNQYYIEEHYKDTPNTLAVLMKIKEIANEGNGTEVIDGDYGHVPNFYLHMSIGSWDKKYQVIQRGYLPTPAAPSVTGCHM